MFKFQIWKLFQILPSTPQPPPASPSEKKKTQTALDFMTKYMQFLLKVRIERAIFQHNLPVWGKNELYPEECI